MTIARKALRWGAIAALVAGLAPAPTIAQVRPKLGYDVLKVAFDKGERVVLIPWSLFPPKHAALKRLMEGGRLFYRVSYCYQGSLEGKPVGYACFADVIGRQRPITFLLKIDHPQGTIAFYEIIAYREQIGKEVGFPPFQRQFYGKSLQNPLEFGVDLRNITGATLSSHHLRDGFRQLLMLYEQYLRDLPLIE